MATAPGLPDLTAQLGISHTQTTTQNQQGAVINSGISFAPLPAPAGGTAVNNPAVPFLSRFTNTEIVIGGGLLFLAVAIVIKLIKG